MDGSLYLQHYGVKGMKWGVRRREERAYTKESTRLNKERVSSARQQLRTSKEQYRSNKTGASKARLKKARRDLREAKFYKKYNARKEKTSLKELDRIAAESFINNYSFGVGGKSAVRNAVRGTEMGKYKNLSEGYRRATTKQIATVAGMAVGGQAIRAAAKNPKVQAAVKRGVMNAALFYANANAPKGASQAVRNLQPIAALPAATKRLRRG